MTVAVPVPKLSGLDAFRGWTLLVIQVLPVMAVVTLFPALPVLSAQFHDTKDAALLVPMIVTLPALCIALFSSPAGWLIDRFGRRPIMLGALAMYCVTGLAPVFLTDLTAIVISRAFLGLAEACLIPVASTLIADYFGEGRHKWLSWMSVVQSAFGTLFIACGGWLADLSWRGPFVIYIVALPLFLIAVFFLHEPKVKTAAEKAVVPKAFPWIPALIIGGVTFVASVLYYVGPLHIAMVFRGLGSLSATNAGFIQAATSIGYIIGAFYYRRIYNQSPYLLLALSAAVIGAGLVGIGLSGNLAGISLFAFVQQLGAGMIIPCLMGWAQSVIPFEQRGRVMGIWAMAFFTGQFGCSAITLAVSDKVGGLLGAFVVLGAVTLILGVVSWFFSRLPAARLQ